MRDWLRILCAVLILSLGFSHKPLQAHPIPTPADAVYALPDGSFAYLCVDALGPHEPEKVAWPGCEACRIASGAMLPPPPDIASRLAAIGEGSFPPVTAFVPEAGWRPGSPVRGPPSLFA